MRACVGLGSNLAHPRRQIARAAAAARSHPAHARLALSPNYVTAPLGVDEAQPDYVNAVACSTPALRRARSSTGSNAIERRQRRKRVHATPPGRSTSICYYSAAAACGCRVFRCRIRACTDARSCFVR
jgi:2-amino-4-hydroxy-6-hydroxymethyldihydropteridine diphosphokinase